MLDFYSRKTSLLLSGVRRPDILSILILLVRSYPHSEFSLRFPLPSTNFDHFITKSYPQLPNKSLLNKAILKSEESI